MRIYDGRDSFYQWDSNQKVVHSFNVGDEVHFANMRQPTALTVRAYQLNNEVVADVPNILLQSSYPIYIYWMNLDSNGQFTKEEFTISVNQRPKPSGYVYTETEVLSYEYLDARIDELEQNGVSNEQISNAIEDYLEKNPITGGASQEEVEQIHQNKEDIENLKTDKLDASKLPEAVDEALAQAKASGEFDGKDGNDGQDGKDYVLTDADKQEIAELASEMVEVPEGGTVTDEQIADAVEDYFAENPVIPVATVEPAEDDIPKVYFTGTLPTSKADEDVQLTMHYISKTADFAYPVTLKVQGSSSANYPKKNFTLKLYEDETYESKKKLAFKNWSKMNKFVLKAHWVDHSHVRNVGSAKIWGKIVKSRSDYDTLPEELRNAPNNGATDGFTCKVFCNGVYQGLYEWIVAKDKLFGQDDENVKHSILNSEWNNQSTCAFATTSPTINGNWSEELLDSMTAETKTSMENWIAFVAGSSDEYFVANAENYFDVQSVIDADIFDRVFCTVDNLCRNQIVFKYDSKWYMGKWDLDAVLGLPPMPSQSFFAYNTEYQKGYVAYKDYGITNLLYQRVETLFMDRFKARYAELRSSVLTIDNILDVYERLTDTIKTYDGLLEEDYASTTGGGAFTGIPHKTENNIQQIRAFVSQRIPYMDDVVENMSNIPDEPDVPDEPDEPDVPDDTVVAEDFDSSTWTANYYNDDGVLTEHSGMYHSQLIPIDLGDEDVSRKTVISGSAQYLRVSYFDADYKYVGFVLKNPIEISPPDGAVYYAVSAMTANKSDVIITVTEYELNGNLMSNVGWHYGSVHGGTGATISGKNDIISDAFDISGYAGETVTIDVEGTIGITGQKLIYYGADGAFIGAGYDKSYQGTANPFDVTIPTNAVTAKAGMLAAATTFRLYYNGNKIAESSPTEIQ